MSSSSETSVDLPSLDDLLNTSDPARTPTEGDPFAELTLDTLTPEALKTRIQAKVLQMVGADGKTAVRLLRDLQRLRVAYLLLREIDQQGDAFKLDPQLYKEMGALQKMFTASSMDEGEQRDLDRVALEETARLQQLKARGVDPERAHILARAFGVLTAMVPSGTAAPTPTSQTGEAPAVPLAVVPLEEPDDPDFVNLKDDDDLSDADAAAGPDRS